MPQIGAIFTDTLPAEHRKFLRALLEFLRQSGYDKVHVPCAGQFTIVNAAMEAGYEKSNIYASDISLYSGMLGYLITKQPIEELGHEIVSSGYYDWYREQKVDLNKAGVLCYLMKLAQLRDAIHYERAFKEEMMFKRDVYKDKLVEQLRKAVKKYEGINYRQADVREYLHKETSTVKEDCVVVFDVPAWSKASDKMFGFAEYIKYHKEVVEFDFQKEWIDGYYATKEINAPHVFYTYKDVVKVLPQEDIIFANETGNNKYSYTLISNPAYLDGFTDKYRVHFKPKSEEEVSQFEFFPPDAEITSDMKVTVRNINKATAVYYRDLLAHRLGATVSESYMAIFLDGKFLAVCAFNTSFIRRLQTSYVFESFCFNISHEKYENLNRLCMLLLLSKDFKTFLETEVLQGNPYVELLSMRTVCLSKYRKMKLNNGLMDVESVEKLDNGTYKIMYEKTYYEDRDYKKCLEIYLQQDVRLMKKYREAQGIQLPSLKNESNYE